MNGGADLFEVLGVPSPEQARRILLALGLANGPRTKQPVPADAAPAPGAARDQRAA